ncbi:MULTISPECIES: hypothetical protein [unclassified Variovorax]|uniref:hypothetical protein n=1 Tax=unclassified Variovorax TaxID=663243 RepID=UPI0013197E53|nr:MULTISPECIES: hypothetical protein [unclassified Variovorax]VTU42561.1 hypothetical protein SRS16P1_00300 [Variovorax sp. SRS16]VTU42585.1 hypothetical protein E5P1_00298 [Variovorax sp. PBL-E5]VTU43937.1 hypothetical protein H6P1_00631 [Variovorax sp. PBL-H6]
MSEESKTKKPFFKRLWFWALVAVVVVGASMGERKNDSKVASTSSTTSSEKAKDPKKSVVTLPPAEEDLIRVISGAQRESKDAENDMQRGGTKANRDKLICQQMRSLAVSNWVGKVEKIDSNSDGKGVLELSIAPGITVKTWNNAISDVLHGTLIEPGTPVFQTASQMKRGQYAVFSGSFFRGTEADCLAEQSVTLRGKLEAPELVFKFSSVAPYIATQSAAAAQGPVPASNPAVTTAVPQAAAAATVDPAAGTKVVGQIEADGPKTLGTVAGELKVTELPSGERAVTLGGAPLFTGEDAQWQSIVRRFALSGGRDAVLLASSGGRGNSCETLYFFVILEKNNQAKWTPEFGTCSPGGTFSQDGDRISLSLPAVGKMEVSIFDGKQVIEDGKPVVLVAGNDPSK